MASRKMVPASTVRTWANENPGDFPAPGTRGKLNPATVKAFHKANPRLRYVQAGEAQSPHITVKVAATDSRGRNITKPVTVTHAEARAALGQPTNTRGRIPVGKLAEALAQK